MTAMNPIRRMPPTEAQQLTSLPFVEAPSSPMQTGKKQFGNNALLVVCQKRVYDARSKPSVYYKARKQN